MLSSSLAEDLLFLLGSKDSLFQVRKLASVCGKIFSALGNGIGNITRLMTRDTFAVVNSVTNWNSLASLTPDCINELNFWKDNLVTINGVPLWPVKRKPTKIVYPDASNSACGSWIQFVEIILLQNWSDLESSWVPCCFTVFSSVYRLPRGTDCCRLHRWSERCLHREHWF